MIDLLSITNYKLLSDIDIMSPYVSDDNIVVSSWSSSTTYAYKNNTDIVVNKFNTKIINSLDKKYILLVGDTPLTNKVNKKVLTSEYEELLIFNYIKEKKSLF